MPRLEHPYAWLFCTFAALGACLYGYDGVYFTGVTAIETFIEHFGTQKSGGTYEISSSQLSLMTSVINIGGLVSSLSAVPLNDYLSRKSVFLVRSIMITVRVILQLAADHQTSYIHGRRILLSYGVSNFSATSPLYIGVSNSS
jgi:SP family sugar:H+ symporter-like MFS transporter